MADGVWLALAATGTATLLAGNPRIGGFLGLAGAGLLFGSAWGLTGILAFFLTTATYSVAFSLVFCRLDPRAGDAIRLLSRLSAALLVAFGLYVAGTGLLLVGI